MAKAAVYISEARSILFTLFFTRLVYQITTHSPFRADYQTSRDHIKPGTEYLHRPEPHLGGV
jgi:hypothetical protein